MSEIYARSVTDAEKPLGMSGVAWRGCGCSACRGERRRYLGVADLPKEQATLDISSPRRSGDE